jgi:hypothetical protein
MFNDFFLRKWCRLWDNVEKYCRARQAIDGQIGHVHSTQDTNTKLHDNRSSGSRVVLCGQTDGLGGRQTDRHD